MANIVSIATAVPQYCHNQTAILHFMQQAYGLNETDKRKLAFLYQHSGITTRYSTIADFSLQQDEWTFLPKEAHTQPSIETRMELYKAAALPLSMQATSECLEGIATAADITHLITVSCTGMSAPGLDLEIVEAMELAPTIFRTSVNFMGCYAAIHALKLAKMILDTNTKANVLIVATELCTLHFQQTFTLDNAASSLLFADGCAAVLMSNTLQTSNAINIANFYSTIAFKGKNEMAWEISSEGFLMTLSGYVPKLIEEDIAGLVHAALAANNLTQNDITHWCIHPGGRKIVDVIQQKLALPNEAVLPSRHILDRYGNMSSPTILFVLKEMMDNLSTATKPASIFGVAFGPGLTMETFTAFSA